MGCRRAGAIPIEAIEAAIRYRGAGFMAPGDRPICDLGSLRRVNHEFSSRPAKGRGFH